MQHSKVSASARGMGRQGCRHSRPRTAGCRPSTEAVLRICRAPTRNPGDCLHVPTEQQLLFNGEGKKLLGKCCHLLGRCFEFVKLEALESLKHILLSILIVFKKFCY